MAAHHAMSGRFSLRLGLVVVMWALLVVYVVGRLRHGEGFDPGPGRMRRHGCDEAQGYHVLRPVPAAEIEHWLDQRTATSNPGPA